MQPDDTFTFANRNRTSYPWNEEVDQQLQLTDPEPSEFPAMAAEIPGVDLERNTPTPAIEDQIDTYNEEETPQQQQQQAAAAKNNTNIDLLPQPNQIPAEPNEFEPDAIEDDDDAIEGIEQISEALAHPEPIKIIDEAEPPEPIEIEEETEPQEAPENDEEEAHAENDTQPGTEPVTEGKHVNNNEEDNDSGDTEEEHNGGDTEGQTTSGVRRSKRAHKGQRTSVRYHDEYGNMNVQECIQMNLDLNTEKAANVRAYTDDEVEDYMIHVIMTQFLLKAGMKKFKECGKLAAMKELKQLHDMETFVPVDGNALTAKQRRMALASLMFLKEKRSGEIKGRACVDGRPQRETIPKEEAASPTAATESVVITSVIDAHKNRDVATLDIPGACLHAKNDDKNVFMTLRGLLAELMVKIAPKIYREYLMTTTKGQKILYV